ncbi:hypothetical protein B0H13DRAFT_2184495 [Mycena leptocephala]|nr:hypothetical protein B0H13DRAFT_2184495 [Mycena leptocephala]
MSQTWSQSLTLYPLKPQCSGLSNSLATGAHIVDQTFLEEIICNPKHRGPPTLVNDLANNVVFEGNDPPSMPMNWLATSALKALEVTLVNTLIEKKYAVKTDTVLINTDRANLLYMGALLTRVDPDGANAKSPRLKSCISH